MPKTAGKKAAAKDTSRDMHLAIYAIGGAYNGEKVGVAHDVTTALSLTHLIRLTGGESCKVRGYGLARNMASEEYALDAFRRYLMGANIRTKFQPRELDYLRSDEVNARGEQD